MAALQTFVLIALYEPGALATLADPQVFSVAFVPAPEPSLSVAASLALAGLFAARRRRPQS